MKRDDLFKEAKKARQNAYAPYSTYKIGSAILTSDGRIFSGCNVENSSYGATLCAERVAILKAISEGATRISECLVLSDADPAWPPCGMCRQVLNEFASDKTLVHIANVAGTIDTLPFSDLLPRAHGKDDLA